MPLRPPRLIIRRLGHRVLRPRLESLRNTARLRGNLLLLERRPDLHVLRLGESQQVPAVVACTHHLLERPLALLRRLVHASLVEHPLRAEVARGFLAGLCHDDRLLLARLHWPDVEGILVCEATVLVRVQPGEVPRLRGERGHVRALPDEGGTVAHTLPEKLTSHHFDEAETRVRRGRKEGSCESRAKT